SVLRSCDCCQGERDCGEHCYETHDGLLLPSSGRSGCATRPCQSRAVRPVRETVNAIRKAEAARCRDGQRCYGTKSAFEGLRGDRLGLLLHVEEEEGDADADRRIGHVECGPVVIAHVDVEKIDDVAE